ncbi:MAG: ferredoxin [Alphaproteobacteria bacterium]|nr:ferredoxin [Alphaproteobacteria bacterium]
MIDGQQDEGATYAKISDVLAKHGLSARGGLQFDVDGPAVDGQNLKSLVLVGHVGSSHWPHFRRFQLAHGGRDPLDEWSKQVMEPIADAFSCAALYPFEKPWWPFQSWISQSEGLKASPLGILIHPEFGLWHGYRAALGFTRSIRLPEPSNLQHPCDHCEDRPCLSACPAGALDTGHFEVGRCRTYLADEMKSDGCLSQGCASRNACPVGNEYRYDDTQLRFHMAALTLPDRPGAKGQ